MNREFSERCRAANLEPACRQAGREFKSSGTITRLAPSPTGSLHLGNARTFLLNYLLARRNSWRVLMRIEDIDTPRVAAGAADQLMDELRWLGLGWESPVVYQSQRTAEYQAALQYLIDAGLAYPCTCTKKDILLAGGAPHADDGAGIYPGTCRSRYACAADAIASGKPVAWRVRIRDEVIRFTDELAGPQAFDMPKTCGDFVIFRSAGLVAYQLAVVVDDAAAGVDAIVRGDDLLESASRQIYLRRLLGLKSEPGYWHVPLILGPDGKRLAKRNGDALCQYRRAGTPPQRIVGLLGFWSGLLPRRQEASIDDLLANFDPARLTRQPTTFCDDDQRFLR